AAPLACGRGDGRQKGGRGASAGARARRWTTGLLVVEFGLTMVVATALVLGWRQTLRAAREDLVIDPERLVTAGITLPASRYATAAQRLAFYDAVAERITGERD